MKDFAVVMVSAIVFMVLIAGGILMSVGQAKMVKEYIRDQHAKPIKTAQLEHYKS